MMMKKALGITRRGLVLFTATTFCVGAAAGGSGALLWASQSGYFSRISAARRRTVLIELVNRVVPAQGREMKVSFGDSIMRLVAAGVIVPEKFKNVYLSRGELPDWVMHLFTSPSAEPIRFSLETAPYLLNLFWPLGLANKTVFNEDSPLNGEMLARFASTGGWTLGRADNGSEYFNEVEAVSLDERQEQDVLNVAQNVYRPCCNNSTFFQDCNHGSALLGLLELAASQGADSEELYEMALVANAFWYPAQYVETAIYFQVMEKQQWSEVDPRIVLGKPYSSYGGWKNNVHAVLSNADLLPRALPGSNGGCGV
jgi:hypothetical protein